VFLIQINGPLRPQACEPDCTDFFAYKQKNFAIPSKVFSWRHSPQFQRTALSHSFAVVLPVLS
jgi:hypothetical protein